MGIAAPGALRAAVGSVFENDALVLMARRVVDFVAITRRGFAFARCRAALSDAGGWRRARAVGIRTRENTITVGALGVLWAIRSSWTRGGTAGN